MRAIGLAWLIIFLTGCQGHWTESAQARELALTTRTEELANPTTDSDGVATTSSTTPLLLQLADMTKSNPQRVYFAAATLGDKETVRILRERGVDINVRDPETSYSALHQVVLDKNTSATHLLLEQGADANVLNAEQTPPVYYAISLDDYKTAKVLLEHNADANIAEPGMRFTPLHVAASNRDSTATELLLRHKADPNLKNINGVTPLHLAVSMRDVECTRLLLEAGADPKLKTNVGRSALDVAKDRGIPKLTELVERYWK